MKIGIIDVGSNTVRIVVYKTDGDKIKEIVNERYFVGLIEFVKKGWKFHMKYSKQLKTSTSIPHLQILVKSRRTYEIFL